jgi:hypothetical protein
MSDIEVHVLVPNNDGGVSVVSAVDLITRLLDESFDEAVLNAGIDSTYSDADVIRLVDKVRALNATGDANAYWSPDE